MYEDQQTFTRAELERRCRESAICSTDVRRQRRAQPRRPWRHRDAGAGIRSPYDTDEDGRVDAVVWNFSDGTFQVLVDESGDGQADALYIDTDGDGNADVQIFDNEDGSYTILQDADGDGVFENEGSMTRAELDEALPGISDLLDTQLGDAVRAGHDAGPDTPPATDGTTDDGGVV